MRSYETTFILHPALDADGVTREVGSLKKFITSQGGEVTVEREWGRRKLAFPIKDQSEGTYYVFRFTLGNEGLKELSRWFRLNENVLRHLLIRDEGIPLDYLSSQSESDERTRDYSERRYSRPGGDRGAAPSRAHAAPAPAAAPAPGPSGEAAAAESVPAGESTAGAEEPGEPVVQKDPSGPGAASPGGGESAHE